MHLIIDYSNHEDTILTRRMMDNNNYTHMEVWKNELIVSGDDCESWWICDTEQRSLDKITINNALIYRVLENIDDYIGQ